MRADVHDMADEIRRTCGGRDADGWLRYVAVPARAVPHRDAALHRAQPRLAAAAGQRHRSPGWSRWAASAGSSRKVGHYVQDERLRRLFSFQAMYAGLAPAQALAIYAVITYMDCVAGVYFPEGGMHAVPRALAGAAAQARRRFRYDTTVTAIDVANGRARGVLTSTGERIAADVVVVNADLPTAYAQLLPGSTPPRRVRRLRYSPSAVVLHAGSTAEFDGLAHHTIDFGAAWDDDVRRDHRPRRGDERPVLPAHQPDPHRPFARTGRRGTPTTRCSRRRTREAASTGSGSAPRYREHILETLEKRGYAGFEAGIETEHLVTPADWARAGPGRGRAVRRRAHLRPDRPVPPAHARSPRRQPGVLRVEHPARRRRADGARVRPARGPADHRDAR